MLQFDVHERVSSARNCSHQRERKPPLNDGGFGCSRSPTVPSTIDSARNSSEGWFKPAPSVSPSTIGTCKVRPELSCSFGTTCNSCRGTSKSASPRGPVGTTSGFTHRLFDERSAKAFIGGSLGARHERAFERCYHPAMQADYFRLCYLLVEGGFYVDADDVCVGTDIGWLFDDGRLKLQPLCYDIASGTMVNPSVFLRSDAYNPSWIFYFNNNPLIASRGHPIIERALSQATDLLELAGEDVLPEIQTTTGPGNLSKSIFDLGTRSGVVSRAI